MQWQQFLLFLLFFLPFGVQGLLLGLFGACKAACLGGTAAMQSFCGSTTPLFTATPFAWFPPVCYSVAIGLGTPGGQAACIGLCNWLTP